MPQPIITQFCSATGGLVLRGNYNPAGLERRYVLRGEPRLGQDLVGVGTQYGSRASHPHGGARKWTVLPRWSARPCPGWSLVTISPASLTAGESLKSPIPMLLAVPIPAASRIFAQYGQGLPRYDLSQLPARSPSAPGLPFAIQLGVFFQAGKTSAGQSNFHGPLHRRTMNR